MAIGAATAICGNIKPALAALPHTFMHLANPILQGAPWSVDMVLRQSSDMCIAEPIWSQHIAVELAKDAEEPSSIRKLISTASNRLWIEGAIILAKVLAALSEMPNVMF
jgi:hypothetical protein